MTAARKASWGETEFYEILCLMMIGTCCWIIGVQLGAFRLLDTMLQQHDLNDFLTLGFFMGVGGFIGSIRKSVHLRRTMMQRDVAEAQANAIARHDPMTGLANRHRLLETIEARRTSRVPATVLLIDLDRFKPVNDLHGHLAGDAVLTVVAERLQAAAPPGSLTARLGGDEFAVLIQAGLQVDHGPRIARTLIDTISAPIFWNGIELSVGATVGIAPVEPETDAEAVLHAADLAMAQGKKEGRGGCRVFESAIGEDLKKRALRERDLRAAIDNGEIVPFFQPVICLTTRTLTGFEVLARWPHAEYGLLPPSEFITVAEESGMIADLSYLLLRRACIDAKTWPAHLQLAVNISPQQFEDPHLATKILDILKETGFDPERLEVEITESALVKDLDATRRTLNALRELGVRIALDDFGTGYSSLYHLRELRFDKLKIDRSYVNTIAMSSERAQLVDAIIKLGTSLGLVTTAEGIETESSVDWLENQGCNFGQGYLFGRPMSKDQADRMFAAGMLPLAALDIEIATDPAKAA